MIRTNSNIRTLLILTLGFIFISCGDKKEPPPPLSYTGENPRIQVPLSPEDSRKHIQVPEGFDVQLYAAEPDIINPIAFTWDERGRLWVVQSKDYPHGIENEVGGDRITICEDTDGDGKADKFIDFATEQSLTTGITLVKGGAIVAQAEHAGRRQPRAAHLHRRGGRPDHLRLDHHQPVAGRQVRQGHDRHGRAQRHELDRKSVV